LRDFLRFDQATVEAKTSVIRYSIENWLDPIEVLTWILDGTLSRDELVRRAKAKKVNLILE
jgi:hypothetical protein